MIPYPKIVQGTPEWWMVRRGLATAGEFSRIITPKRMEYATARIKFIHDLIGNLYDPLYPRESATNEYLKEGNRREPESRRWYAMQVEEEVTTLGFCTTDDGRFGYSPDALVGENGLAELKNPSPEVHTSYLLSGELPVDYAPQCYGGLYVSGRKWLDFVSYCPSMPKQLKVRVYPKGRFYDTMVGFLDKFHDEYQAALESITGKVLGKGLPVRSLVA